jgi:glycine reductase
MLAAKLKGQSFLTEVPIHIPERVIAAVPIADLSRATIALVTTGGLVRKGNPDKQVASNATRYFRHSVAELQSLSDKDWEAYHSGYFNHIVNKNPNYILPLSFMRDLEAKGEIGGVYPWIYALPGVSTPVAQAKRMGADIARELEEARVDGCLLVAT